jgi:hypothetical protein
MGQPSVTVATGSINAVMAAIDQSHSVGDLRKIAADVILAAKKLKSSITDSGWIWNIDDPQLAIRDNAGDQLGQAISQLAGQMAILKSYNDSDSPGDMQGPVRDSVSFLQSTIVALSALYGTATNDSDAKDPQGATSFDRAMTQMNEDLANAGRNTGLAASEIWRAIKSFWYGLPRVIRVIVYVVLAVLAFSIVYQAFVMGRTMAQAVKSPLTLAGVA